MTDTAVLRIVVRNGFGRNLADLLLEDLRVETKLLDRYKSNMPADERRETFHH
jgi:glutamate decarboxylase